MKIHRTLRITGRVQGVGFRFQTKLKADVFGVTGFVRNEDDGSVYIEAEGETENLEKFIDWCRQGPRHATVEHVEIMEGTMKFLKTFEAE